MSRTSAEVKQKLAAINADIESSISGIRTSKAFTNELEDRERFEELSGDLSDDVRFALLYNLGILAHRNGNYAQAADFFKQALLIDGSSVDAKVNLELSLVDEGGHSGEAAVQPVMESRHEGALENAVYSIIRDQEEGQWKNMRKEETVSDAEDY